MIEKMRQEQDTRGSSTDGHEMLEQQRRGHEVFGAARMLLSITDTSTCQTHEESKHHKHERHQGFGAQDEERLVVYSREERRQGRLFVAPPQGCLLAQGEVEEAMAKTVVRVIERKRERERERERGRGCSYGD
ncbi:hypothetical protein L7F22_055474 [Adiantum nelumboides]|nr:hypothetical protein [Adiantum nelumboides]